MTTLFKAIVGSYAYGTYIEGVSDIDFKEVHQCSLKDLLGTNYRQQIDYSKDRVSFEVRRYLELLKSANPTVLEILYSPEDCVKRKHPAFDVILKVRDKFLTKKCRESFGGYAVQQLKKARGLDKKMNYEQDKVQKKEPIDFCYLIHEGHTYPFAWWLDRFLIDISQVGLVNLDHAPHCFAVYIDRTSSYKYKGVFENGSKIITSSVPKGERDFGTLVFNKDDYARHKKDWDSYQTWLKERNTARFVDCKNHGQMIDGKNLLHTRRLLDVAMEIPTKGLIVRRPNADYLLQIRRGEVNLEDIIKQAEEDIVKMDELYEKADLPDEAPDIEPLLLEIRKYL